MCDNGWHFSNLCVAENFSLFVQPYRTASRKSCSEGQHTSLLAGLDPKQSAEQVINSNEKRGYVLKDYLIIDIFLYTIFRTNPVLSFSTYL